MSRDTGGIKDIEIYAALMKKRVASMFGEADPDSITVNIKPPIIPIVDMYTFTFSVEKENTVMEVVNKVRVVSAQLELLRQQEPMEYQNTLNQLRAEKEQTRGI